MAGDDYLLIKAQNNAWKGWYDYFLSNGVDKDFEGLNDNWGSTPPGSTRAPVGPYLRNHSAKFGPDKVIVYEPCNYTSNIVYYHDVTRLCEYEEWSSTLFYKKHIKRWYSFLAFGSSFWHSSHTYLGYLMDNQAI